MPIWHQSPKLTPRYFLETPRLFGYPIKIWDFKIIPFLHLAYNSNKQLIKTVPNNYHV